MSLKAFQVEAGAAVLLVGAEQVTTRIDSRLGRPLQDSQSSDHCLDLEGSTAVFHRWQAVVEWGMVNAVETLSVDFLAQRQPMSWRSDCSEAGYGR